MTASQWQKKGVLGNVVPSSPLEEASKPELYKVEVKMMLTVTKENPAH